jgi:hypothetical protein
MNHLSLQPTALRLPCPASAPAAAAAAAAAAGRVDEFPAAADSVSVPAVYLHPHWLERMNWSIGETIIVAREINTYETTPRSHPSSPPSVYLEVREIRVRFEISSCAESSSNTYRVLLCVFPVLHLSG